MTRTMILASLAVLSATLVACRNSSTAQPERPTPPPSATDARVHTLKLPELDSPLPAGAGREAVQVHCAVCHTTHYILNQPPFPRQTWTAEVTKMQKVYSAPIPADKVTEIVDYLVAVRGASAAGDPPATRAARLRNDVDVEAFAKLQQDK